ncbi:uncharacterized protein LOC114293537 [Camellia sinensis]|uniref:uncharacterized protein LOC114293537 n=1 Tax=Camellia sinensis TaxID=4442 RepID=UPI0010367EF4|nr:uncharacterized protein LOC114293537 [Camellia sinensis]
MNPPKFQGGIKRMKAKAWVLEMEKLFEIFPSTDTQKVSLAAFTLDDDARRCVRDRKTTEFQMLTQGNKAVAEYDHAFTKLTRYAPYMVNNEYRKARKFESGLRDPIQDRVNMLNMPTYAGVLDKAILAEANLSRSQSSGENQRKRQDYDNRQAPSDVNKKVNVGSANNANQEGGTRPTCSSCGKQRFGVCYRVSGACFECDKMGHRIKDCPKVKARDDKKK